MQIVIIGGAIVPYKRLQNSVFINADRHKCLINLDLTQRGKLSVRGAPAAEIPNALTILNLGFHLCAT